MLNIYISAGVFFLLLQVMLISATALFALGLVFFAYEVNVLEPPYVWGIVAAAIGFFFVGGLVLVNISPYHKLHKRKFEEKLSRIKNKKERDAYANKVLGHRKIRV
jgi:hypothetical protein